MPIATASVPTVEGFFDAATHTLTYLVADPATGAAVVIGFMFIFMPLAIITSPGCIPAVHAPRYLAVMVVFEGPFPNGAGFIVAVISPL